TPPGQRVDPLQYQGGPILEVLNPDGYPLFYHNGNSFACRAAGGWQRTRPSHSAFPSDHSLLPLERLPFSAVPPPARRDDRPPLPAAGAWPGVAWGSAASDVPAAVSKTVTPSKAAKLPPSEPANFKRVLRAGSVRSPCSIDLMEPGLRPHAPASVF